MNKKETSKMKCRNKKLGLHKFCNIESYHCIAFEKYFLSASCKYIYSYYL